MYVLGVIFTVLAGVCSFRAFFLGGYVHDMTNQLLACILFIIPACTCFLIGEMHDVYNKFVSNYYRPANREQFISASPVQHKPAPPSMANNVRYNDVNLSDKRMIDKEISNISSKDVDAFIDGIK